MSEAKLFSEFPPITTQEWEEKILADLKGADYNKKLITKTVDGIEIKPYYRSEDTERLDYLNVKPAEFPFVRGTKTGENNFEIRQDIIVNNCKNANQKALELLSKGVTSLGFIFNTDITITENNFENLLGGIFIENIETNYISDTSSLEIIKLLSNYVRKNKLNPDKIKGSVQFSPLANATLKGNFSTYSETLKQLFDFAKSNLPKLNILTANGSIYKNAGSTVIQELAFTLSSSTDYLQTGKENGISVEELAPKINFILAAGSNYFIEIAKIRAARLLWAKIVETYAPDNTESAKMKIHTVTTHWNKTIYDPYVNVLRTTTEAMSAIIGGTDSLCITPLDKIYKTPDNFSERIARNIQIILKEEAYLDKALDPSAGSYFIENLTNSIIEQTWELFLEIEKQGGYLKAVKNNFIQSQIEETAAKRELNIATRKEILLGTNQYPNRTETLEKKINLQDNNKTQSTEFKSLKQYRAAEQFEKLRLKTEKSGKKVNVFMFTYGNLAMRKARATFAGNFFACAGFNIIDNNGFKTLDEGIKESIKKQADIVVICSSDDEYPEIAPVINNKLKETIIAVAGYPKKSIEELQNAGIKHFIHVKSNVLETLKNFQKELGI